MRIRFIKKYKFYNIGENANLNEKLAKKLLKNGVAIKDKAIVPIDYMSVEL